MATMGLNAYSGMLTIVTGVELFWRFLAPTPPHCWPFAILALIWLATSSPSPPARLHRVIRLTVDHAISAGALDLDKPDGLLLRPPRPLCHHPFFPAARHLRRLGLAGNIGLYHRLNLQHTILQFGGCV